MPLTLIGEVKSIVVVILSTIFLENSFTIVKSSESGRFFPRTVENACYPIKAAAAIVLKLLFSRISLNSIRASS